jgi:hypothetical protein
MPVSSEALNLVTFLAPVNFIRDRIALVRLITLAPAEWTILVTSKGLSLHYLLEVPYQLIFL